MKRKIINIFSRKFSPTQLAWIAFSIAVIIGQLIAFRIYLYEKDKESLRLKQEAFHIKSELGMALRNSITVTQMIAFLVEKDLIGNDFDSVAKALLKRNKFIDAIQLVKGNSIIKTFPLKGNEITIGYEVLKDSIHKREAYKSLQRHELYFEGPLHLKQGGVGVVGRLPITKDDEYWGFAAVIIKTETLFKALGIDSNGNNELYSYQIEKMGLKDNDEKFFFKKEFNTNPDVAFGMFEPIGDWTFYVSSRQNSTIFNTITFSLTWILLAVFWAMFLKFLAEQPRKLELLIAEKTNDLAALNISLEAHAEELVKSNQEMEQFAFSASHDLLEPLRMITSFLHQLEKKYAVALDDKARQYIYFARNGAERMKRLILDLLEFSLVGKNEEIKEDIQLNELLNEVKLLLKKIITDSGAVITYSDLGSIYSFRTPLVQVFQNLIENAIKFRKHETAPIIAIGMVEQESAYLFSVRDNGMGIDEEYFDKIFRVLQSLHSKDEYEGTGMGLSIAKKSLENIGGSIWVESEVGVGSVFYFTIPKSSVSPTDE